MRVILFIAGLLSLSAGILVAGSIKSDIQLQIVATCVIGAVLMFGQVAVLSGQKHLQNRLDNSGTDLSSHQK